MDSKVLSHAISLARGNDAALYLFHIVEGVSGQIYGGEADDKEARHDKESLEGIAAEIRTHGIEAFPHLGYGSVPKAIIRLAKEHNLDLLVMGGHGHRGLKDIFFGASISEVRHGLTIPVLVVQ